MYIGTLTWKKLVTQTWQHFWKDGIPNQSAMLSFYFLLSIFPFLLFMISALGLIFRSSGQVILENFPQYLNGLAPSSATNLIQVTLGEIIYSSGGGKLSLALLITFWAASQGAQALISGMNIAYNVTEDRSWFQIHRVTLKMTIASCILLACALLILVCGELIMENLLPRVGFDLYFRAVWYLIKFGLLAGFGILIFDIWYYYAPNVKHRKWRWFMPGSFVAMGIWLMASLGFKLYLNFFDRYTVTYGSIGAVIVLLWWLYLTGIAVLVGAEVNSEVENSA